MSRLNINLLDLPDEVLLIILRKLNNIDVLYSLLDINDGRLDILAQEEIFTNILNFVDIDNISLIDRFCIDILPRIHHNVKYFILEPVFMERILNATVYSNLTELKLFNFEEHIALKYFTGKYVTCTSSVKREVLDKSPLRSVFQQQITNLTLVNNDKSEILRSPTDYTINVYVNILNFFKNLKHLNIIGSYVMLYPGLSLCNLPSTTFHSSILTHLYIHVETFDDCLYLLDGRLKQLTTFSVNVYAIDTSWTIVHNMDTLPNLKCFTLKSFFQFKQLDPILSLLRRMSYLENLTLYLRIKGRNKIIDGTCIQNDILHYMPQLHSFNFYISTRIDIHNLSHNLSPEDIQQTLINIERQNPTSMINHIFADTATYSIFSLPFAFDHLEDLGNIFPNIVFSYVTHLFVEDYDAFKHEFFVRIARSFPLLRHLRMFNMESPLIADFLKFSSDIDQARATGDPALLAPFFPAYEQPDSMDNYSYLTSLMDVAYCRSYSMVEYLHLTSLDVANTHECYLEQFLNETKAYVPCLTELKVGHRQLKAVTKNFTNEATRRNCAKVKRLNLIQPLDNAEDHSHYFPSL